MRMQKYENTKQKKDYFCHLKKQSEKDGQD